MPAPPISTLLAQMMFAHFTSHLHRAYMHELNPHHWRRQVVWFVFVHKDFFCKDDGQPMGARMDRWTGTASSFSVTPLSEY